MRRETVPCLDRAPRATAGPGWAGHEKLIRLLFAARLQFRHTCCKVLVLAFLGKVELIEAQKRSSGKKLAEWD